jgi:hypothetical protein
MLPLEEQISRKCIHFNGVMERVCKAGISYADVREEPEEGPYKFPCLKQGGKCSSAQFRTDEEVKAKISQIEGDGVKVMLAIISIKDHVHETNKQSGMIKCQCGGEGDLHYAVAEINGHVWAKCTTCKIAFNE